MSNSLRRLAPLSGVPFAILLGYAFFGTPSTPNVKTRGPRSSPLPRPTMAPIWPGHRGCASGRLLPLLPQFTAHLLQGA